MSNTLSEKSRTILFEGSKRERRCKGLSGGGKSGQKLEGETFEDSVHLFKGEGSRGEEWRGSSDQNYIGLSWRAAQEENSECVRDFCECCEYRHGPARMSSLLIWQHDVVIYTRVPRHP